MTQPTDPTPLSDGDYEQALSALADYEYRIAESELLAQRDSLRVAETLDRLYHDPRWVEERNAQRVTTAKTPRGGRPVDPTSRSQFSTWVRDRYNRIAPSTTYRLLDAQRITTEFLRHGERTPSQEAQVRPLKSLLSVANGQGERIPAVWELACKLAADAGRDQPTSEDVKHGLAEWRRVHLPAGQARVERAEDRAWVKERKAVSAWRELLSIGSAEHINAFLDAVREDVKVLDETGQRKA